MTMIAVSLARLLEKQNVFLVGNHQLNLILSVKVKCCIQIVIFMLIMYSDVWVVVTISEKNDMRTKQQLMQTPGYWNETLENILFRIGCKQYERDARNILQKHGPILKHIFVINCVYSTQEIFKLRKFLNKYPPKTVFISCRTKINTEMGISYKIPIEKLLIIY